MKENLIPDPDRPLPDPYHARTGMKLCPERSLVYDDLKEIEDYAEKKSNESQLTKNKLHDFQPIKEL